MSQPINDQMIARLTPDQASLFWSKVKRGAPEDCWLWAGGVARNGYGTWTRSNGDGTYASLRPHRVAYILTRGAIGDGLQIDHLCRVKLCVNPAHLEPVTASVNQLRVPRDPLRTSYGGSVRARRTATGVRYAVLFRMDGKQTSRTFDDAADAEAFLARIRAVGVHLATTG
jgi:hypothetical protein